MTGDVLKIDPAILESLKDRDPAQLDDEIREAMQSTLQNIDPDFDPDEPYPDSFEEHSNGEKLKPLADLRERIKTQFFEAEAAGKNTEDTRTAFREALLTFLHLELTVRIKPFLLWRAICKRLSDPNIDIGGEGINETINTIENATQFDANEIEHARDLMSTSDPLGIIARAFVLIEDMLDNCFDTYLAHRIDLQKAFKMYCLDKVHLGHALGFIATDECDFIVLLNSIRNKLVHRNNAKKPRFVFSVADERKLWEQFLKIPTFKGDWPAYDQAKSPYFLRAILIRIYLLLHNRSRRIAARKCQELTGYALQPTFDRLASNALTLYTVNNFNRIVERIETEQAARASETFLTGDEN